VRATRYATPLREGGSLPGVVEADDDGMYVVKFRGAGQGAKALVAEIVAGELGRAVGLAVPEIVLVDVDPVLARAEPDPEIQELIEASAGLNVGLDFLPGALAYDAAFEVDPELAALVVWLDELTLNIDRTPRNPNLLIWHDRLWLIDHGAALFPHHAGDLAAAARRDFTAIADHVLAGYVPSGRARPRPSFDASAIVSLVPPEWLDVPASSYVSFLTDRAAFLA
jgi:HipA-like kinase